MSFSPLKQSLKWATVIRGEFGHFSTFTASPRNTKHAGPIFCGPNSGRWAQYYTRKLLEQKYYQGFMVGLHKRPTGVILATGVNLAEKVFNNFDTVLHNVSLFLAGKALFNEK